jgi:hypothetical protein
MTAFKPYLYLNQVSNPEAYPKKCFNEECSKCKHGDIIFCRGELGTRFQSTLCSAGKMLICQNGFIKPKEMEI